MTNADKLIKQATDLRNSNQGAQAAELYRQAKELYISTDQTLKAAEAEHMRAVSYKIESDLKQAMPVYESARLLYARSQDPYGVGRVYRDESIMLEYDGRLEPALALMLLSVDQLETAHKLSSNKKYAAAELGISYIKLGMLNTKLGKYKLAQELIEKGLTLTAGSKQHFYTSTGYMHMAELYIAQEDWKLSSEFLSKALSTLSQVEGDMSRREAQIIGLQAYTLAMQEGDASEVKQL